MECMETVSGGKKGKSRVIALEIPVFIGHKKLNSEVD